MGILDTGLDPQTQGLLAAAFQGLAASGPSRMPVSLGQVIGQGGMTGLNEYQQALAAAQKKRQQDALIALEQQRAASEQQKMARAASQQAAIDAFQRRVVGGEFTKSPAQQALAGGGGPTPENASLIPSLAPKLDRSALYQGMLGTPGLLQQGVTGLATMEENAAKRDATRQDLQIKIAEARAAGQERLAAQLQMAKDKLDSQEQIAQMTLQGKKDIASIAGSLRQPPAPLVVQGDNGNVKLYDRTGSLIKDLGAVGKTAEKPLTEVQGKSALYATRAGEADSIISSMEGKYSPASIATKQGLGKTWGVGGILESGANAALSTKAQQVEQAQRNFVNAILRQESGAAISPTEFDNAQKQYFPQFGDDKKVLEQKRENRKTAIAGLTVMAGPALNRRATDKPGAVIDFKDLPK